MLGVKDYNSNTNLQFMDGMGNINSDGDSPVQPGYAFIDHLKNDLHPTMKPITLLSKLITDGSIVKETY